MRQRGHRFKRRMRGRRSLPGVRQAVRCQPLDTLTNIWGQLRRVVTPGGNTSEPFGNIIRPQLGIVGLADVATELGFQKNDEDFGQTLGVWGVGSGPYLVLPLLGPSTLRDAPARVVDAPLDPLYHYDDVRVRNSLFVVNVVNTRARLLPATDLVERVALDQYAFVRDAYLKRRASLIRDGAPDPEDQGYKDFEEESSSTSTVPEAFPPFKAALVQTAPANDEVSTLLPGDLQQSDRAREGLGLAN